jgi:hypothetical protein
MLRYGVNFTFTSIQRVTSVVDASIFRVKMKAGTEYPF